MDSLIDSYTDSIRRLSADGAAEQKKINTIFYTRSIIFIALFAGFFLLVKTHLAFALLLIPATILVFLVLLNRELKIRRRMAFIDNLVHSYQVEIDLLNNEYERFSPGNEFMDKQHPFLSDLDIFGRRSVFQLLNRTATYGGRLRLARWLTFPFLKQEEIRDRQQALRELADKKDWCHHFTALGFSNKEAAGDKEVIETWLEEDAQFSGTGMKLLCIASPAITITTGVLGLLNIIPIGIFTTLFFVQLSIIGGRTKKINSIHDRLSRKFDSIDKYLSLLRHIESAPFSSDLLKQAKQRLAVQESSASGRIAELRSIVDKLDFRMNMIVAIVLNGIFLWDIQVVRRMEAWKARHKADFMQWIDTVAELDAFISIGLYAANHPDYVMPEAVDAPFIIHAEKTGHPLIASEKLVRNDYHIEGIAKVDLLTGANMAGKSTFLRTVGVNLVLAMTGAPVCAERFRFTPILLFTSLRTNDSLQENESFFYAELKRLGMLIKDYEEGRRVFFLLDEILKGTNSKDQHIGSEALIRKIVQLKGCGIVATHDVELAVLSGELPQNVRNLCFEITISDDKLQFDYKLKEGVCATMNASFLMKKMRII